MFIATLDIKLQIIKFYDPTFLYLIVVLTMNKKGKLIKLPFLFIISNLFNHW